MAFSALLAILPLQLVCHLIVPQSQVFNATNFEVNQLPEQSQPTILPNGAMAVPLRNLPLQVVCQLLVTSNPSVTENGTLVENKTPGPTPTENIIEENVTTTSTPEPRLTIATEETVTGYETTEYETTPVSYTPEGYVKFLEDHAAYKFHAEMTTWYEARDRCIAEGAHLATAHTRERIAHINNLPGNDGANWVHIGIYKSNTTDEWVIDNGLPVDPMPWASGEPTDSGSCVGITPLNDKLVSDIECGSFPGTYACEISL